METIISDKATNSELISTYRAKALSNIKEESVLSSITRKVSNRDKQMIFIIECRIKKDSLLEKFKNSASKMGFVFPHGIKREGWRIIGLKILTHNELEETILAVREIALNNSCELVDWSVAINY